MKIVATTNLNDNLVRAKLLPLLALPQVDEVVWVTDKPGPPLPRTRYVVPRRPRASNLGRLIFRLPILFWQIARTRPGLVMAFNLMPHGLVAFALGRLLGRRVCIHMIGGIDEVRGGGYMIDKRITRPNKALEGLFVAVLKRTDVVVAIGTRTRDYLVSRGVAPARIHVMSSKVDTERFRPLPGEAKQYDLVIAASLIPRKRIDLFLRIVADLAERFPDVRAAVLGEGAQQAELERLAASLGVSHRVNFLGFLPDTEMYYNRARVFVLTSITEGLSLAMMEAMACGLPVVVADVGDLADVVRDGVTGYLVQPPEQEGFVEAISRLLDDEPLRLRMGGQAVQAIHDGYDLEAGARAWRGVLQALSKMHPRRASWERGLLD